MDPQTASSVFPYLRSCQQETEGSIVGEVQGQIPEWLSGSLVRVGSGSLTVGPNSYNHVFDGLALMHRFSFEGGSVRYRNRFLRSDTYRRNQKAGRIVVSELGTRGVPDPCRTIFQRFISLFSRDEMTDNDLVNIVLYGDEAYACSETNSIWKIDSDTLESLEKVRLYKWVPVDTAIAHPHTDTDGTIYNIGSSYGINCYYNIIKFPKKGDGGEDVFGNASVVCRIRSSMRLHLSYHHSFAMTENHFVLVEQPLYLSLPRLAWAQLGAGVYADAMHWEREALTRFHVVSRSSNQELKTVYVSKRFFVFHHINAYEEDGHLVVDMCTYDDGDVIKRMYVKSLEEMFASKKELSEVLVSQARRYVLPLNAVGSKKGGQENLVALCNTDATAYQQPDESIMCHPECLTGSDKWLPELPRINYEYFNGKKYKYFYAIARNKSKTAVSLVKVNVITREVNEWFEEGAIPSEPVFVPQGEKISSEEDSGVVLASLLYTNDETKVSLIVLDATRMSELGRATFHTKSSVPADFHGTFITEKK